MRNIAKDPDPIQEEDPDPEQKEKDLASMTGSPSMRRYFYEGNRHGEPVTFLVSC